MLRRNSSNRKTKSFSQIQYYNEKEQFKSNPNATQTGKDASRSYSDIQKPIILNPDDPYSAVNLTKVGLAQKNRNDHTQRFQDLLPPEFLLSLRDPKGGQRVPSNTIISLKIHIPRHMGNENNPTNFTYMDNDKLKYTPITEEQYRRIDQVPFREPVSPTRTEPVFRQQRRISRPYESTTTSEKGLSNLSVNDFNPYMKPTVYSQATAQWQDRSRRTIGILPKKVSFQKVYEHPSRQQPLLKSISKLQRQNPLININNASKSCIKNYPFKQLQNRGYSKGNLIYSNPNLADDERSSSGSEDSYQLNPKEYRRSMSSSRRFNKESPYIECQISNSSKGNIEIRSPKYHACKPNCNQSYQSSKSSMNFLNNKCKDRLRYGLTPKQNYAHSNELFEIIGLTRNSESERECLNPREIRIPDNDYLASKSKYLRRYGKYFGKESPMTDDECTSRMRSSRITVHSKSTGNAPKSQQLRMKTSSFSAFPKVRGTGDVDTRSIQTNRYESRFIRTPGGYARPLKQRLSHIDSVTMAKEDHFENLTESIFNSPRIPNYTNVKSKVDTNLHRRQSQSKKKNGSTVDTTIITTGRSSPSITIRTNNNRSGVLRSQSPTSKAPIRSVSPRVKSVNRNENKLTTAITKLEKYEKGNWCVLSPPAYSEYVLGHTTKKDRRV